MWWPIFIIGGSWFYVLAVLASIIIIYGLEDDTPPFAVWATIIFFIALWLCGNFNIVTWIINSPGLLCKYGAQYIVIGVVWGIAKYWFFLTDKKRKFDRIVTEYLVDKGIKGSEVPEHLQKDCRAEVYNALGSDPVPTLSSSTKHILFWMTYWPWSMIWTCLNNPLRWAFEEIVYRMKGLFNGMYNKIIGDRAEQFKSWNKPY